VEPTKLVENVRSSRMEVQSYKENNENMMREHNQINAHMMQNLNQLQRRVENGLVPRHEE